MQPFIPPEQRLSNEADAALLFDQCVEMISADLLASGFRWHALTGIFPHHYGVNRRFRALSHPQPPSFRWQQLLTKFMKQSFPTFKKSPDLNDDSYVFLEPIAENWLQAIIFDVHPAVHVGKVFKLRCGIVERTGMLVRFFRTAPMLRVSGERYDQLHDWCPEFSFDTIEEFDQCLASLRQFLAEFTALFSRQIEQLLLRGMNAAVPLIEENGRLTSEQGLAIARKCLADLKITPQGILSVTLGETMGLTHYRINSASQLPEDGKLTKFHQWIYFFATDRGLREVIVPFAGVVRVSSQPLGPQPIGAGPPELLPQTLRRDSPEIAATIWGRYKNLCARYSGMKGLVGFARLDAKGWRAQIEFSGEPNSFDWVLCVLEIEPTSGVLLATTFDERFSKKERTTFVERADASTSTVEETSND